MTKIWEYQYQSKAGQVNLGTTSKGEQSANCERTVTETREMARHRTEQSSKLPLGRIWGERRVQN